MAEIRRWPFERGAMFSQLKLVKSWSSLRLGAALGKEVGRVRTLRGAKRSRRDNVNMFEGMGRLFSIVVL